MSAVRRRARALVPVAAAALIACGCGGEDPKPAAPQPQVDVRAVAPPRPDPAEFRAPIARYKAYVVRQLHAMAAAVDRLSGAAAQGDIGSAKAAWLEADALYESIGAAYGAFGDFDARINGLPGGLPGGTRSPRFMGLHRIELALWRQRSTRAAASYAGRLRRDVRALAARVPGLAISPTDYVLRAHEILEDSLHLQLSGAASPWSGSAQFRIAADYVDQLAQTLADLERPDGSMPRWPLDKRRSGRVTAQTAGAAERLAFVPDLLDPAPLVSRPRLTRVPGGTQ
jgi:hypothetical protein